MWLNIPFIKFYIPHQSLSQINQESPFLFPAKFAHGISNPQILFRRLPYMHSPVASHTVTTNLCNFGQIIEIIPPVKIVYFYLLSWDMEVGEVFAIFMNLVLLSHKLQPCSITFSTSHNGNDHVVMEAEVSIVFDIRQVHKNNMHSFTLPKFSTECSL